MISNLTNDYSNKIHDDTENVIVEIVSKTKKLEVDLTPDESGVLSI